MGFTRDPLVTFRSIDARRRGFYSNRLRQGSFFVNRITLAVYKPP